MVYSGERYGFILNAGTIGQDLLASQNLKLEQVGLYGPVDMTITFDTTDSGQIAYNRFLAIDTARGGNVPTDIIILFMTWTGVLDTILAADPNYAAASFALNIWKHGIHAPNSMSILLIYPDGYDPNMSRYHACARAISRKILNEYTFGWRFEITGPFSAHKITLKYRSKLIKMQ